MKRFGSLRAVALAAATLAAATSAAIVALALPSVAPRAEAQETSGLERFVGSWRYAGSQQQGRQIIDQAVSHAVDPMNFIVRGFAADRLRGKNPLVRRIDIADHGGNVRVTFDGDRTYEAAPGQWRTHRFGGESVRVQFRVRGDALVQLFRTDSGSRRNIYRITGDGRMRLEVTVQSDQLPRDMTYRLNYRQ